MKKARLSYVVMTVLVLAGISQAALITNVSRRNSTNPAPALGGILVDDSLCMVDRAHVYNQIPMFLDTAEYVKVSNVDRNVATYELDITLSADAYVYLFIDKRIGDGVNTDPPLLTSKMTWVAEMGFVDTGFAVAIDEGNNGTLDNFGEIYKGFFKAGTVTLKQQDDGTGRNMYGVAAIPEPMTLSLLALGGLIASRKRS
jgi:hypothetical protein